MNLVVFANDRIAIMADGRYLMSYLSGSRHLWPAIRERGPQNASLLRQARRARELNLAVALPEPAWAPDPNIPTAELAVIEAVLERAAATMAFRVGPGADEGYFAPDEGVVPDAWWSSGDHRAICVQTPDGHWLAEGWVARGGDAGTLCAPGQAIAEGAPPEVVRELERLEKEWEARWVASRAAQELEEKERLKALFGL